MGHAARLGEALWLLGLFRQSIGLPFFALAANGPLIQAWFVRTDHPAAKDPYILYAASNVGSFWRSSLSACDRALRGLGEQTSAWTVAFYILTCCSRLRMAIAARLQTGCRSRIRGIVQRRRARAMPRSGSRLRPVPPAC